MDERLSALERALRADSGNPALWSDMIAQLRRTGKHAQANSLVLEPWYARTQYVNHSTDPSPFFYERAGHYQTSIGRSGLFYNSDDNDMMYGKVFNQPSDKLYQNLVPFAEVVRLLSDVFGTPNNHEVYSECIEVFWEIRPLSLWSQIAHYLKVNYVEVD